MQGRILSIIIFFIIMGSYLIYDRISKRKKKSLDRLMELEKTDTEKDEEEKEKKSFIDSLQLSLRDANINIDARIFIAIIIMVTVILYVGAYYVFKQPVVALAPLPLTLYLLPNAVITTRKEKVMDKFDSELIQVLRRMSAVLRNGSILQALEEAKNIPSLSEKMILLLNEIHHRNKYGDSIEDAFNKVAEKTSSKKFKLATVSIDINKELGSNLSHTLNEIALNIQKMQMNREESKTLMLQTVMIGRVLGVAPFGVVGFIAISNPDYYSVYLQNFGHQIMFSAILVWMLIGVFVIEKFAKS